MVMHPTFADVVLPRYLYRTFTYRIPSRLQGKLQVGSQVLVPFGRTTLQGMILTLSDSLSDQEGDKGQTLHDQVRDILELLDNSPEPILSPDLVTLVRLISEYYLAPLGTTLRLIQPPGSLPRVTRRFMLTDLGKKASEGRSLSPVASQILVQLEKAPKGLALTSLKRAIGSHDAVLRRLKSRGWIKEVETIRAPSAVDAVSDVGLDSFKAPLRIPVGWHPSWWGRFQGALADQRHEEFLLYSPSVLHHSCIIEAIHETLACEHTALIIAPEIDRASRLADEARTHWGKRVEFFHSGLSVRTRHHTWQRIRHGQASVVIGTRSALFVPLPSLGLICVEDEGHASLKEEHAPYYHARDVGKMRAQQSAAALLLCSAHPSVETVKRFSSLGLADSQMNEQKPLASSARIQVVNLQQVPYGVLLSDDMIAGIREALDSRGGVILFLNRKGFSRSLVCKECGETPRCHHCSVTLTVYKQLARLVCLYCGHARAIPVTCPSCLTARIEPSGFGTERLEEVVRQHFPAARIGRFDGDTVKTPAQGTVFRERVQRGEIEIVIGTQMLFQGVPFAQAQFVGIPHADASLHLPDFRSAERTYHALQDAVALAGPGDSHVLLQTSLPTHHVIQAVARQDPTTFYDHELALRQALSYPPFTHLIHLRVSGKSLERVQAGAKHWADLLQTAMGKHVPNGVGLKENDQGILGPIPAFFSQLRGNHRYQILVKSAQLEITRAIVRETLEALETKRGRTGLKFEVEVDPLELL